MRIPLFIGAAVLLATAAGAQDGSEGAANRTPAGAQRFLAAAVKQHDMYWMTYNYSRDMSLTYVIQDVVAESDCISRFEMKPDKGGFRDNAEGTYGAVIGPATAPAFDAFLKKWNLAPAPYRIEWGKVTDLVRSSSCNDFCDGQGNARFIRLQGWSIWFPDVRTAERAEFAMRFLVEKCGLADVEGF